MTSKKIDLSAQTLKELTPKVVTEAVTEFVPKNAKAVSKTATEINTNWHVLDVAATLKDLQVIPDLDSNSAPDNFNKTHHSHHTAAHPITDFRSAKSRGALTNLSNLSSDLAAAHNFSGLTTAAACARQKIYGANQLAAVKSPSLLLRFLRQFHNVLIYILLCSALIAVGLQKWVDAAVIFGVIIINALVGFIQEGKAEKALVAIRALLAPTAKVLRDGQRAVVPTSELVPGDVVIIERGDKVPADLRLMQLRALHIQEAILTGEAHAIEKSVTPVADVNAPLAERTSLAYSGTIVTGGYGVGVVVATGGQTEVGKISTLLDKVEGITTPLLQQMNRFAYWLTAAILGTGIVTFIVGVVGWGVSSKEIFMAIIGLIVAAVPEGLPPILTIILAIGVARMAKQHAIVRRLPAVETMGAVNTICSDKTGTLTCNELRVVDLITAQGHYRWEKDGICHVLQDDLHAAYAVVRLDEHRDLATALLAGAMCNDAEITYATPTMASAAAGAVAVAAVSGKTNLQPENSTLQTLQLHGDELDQALLEVAHHNGMDVALLKKMLPRTDLIPYESEHKFMATLHHDHVQGKAFIYVKGAPESILGMCATQQLDVDYWHKQVDVLAKKGEKVVAIAYKELAHGGKGAVAAVGSGNSMQQLHFADINNLTLVAVFGIIDPPRPEVAAAIAECHAAGVRVKMITGDHVVTARAIAEEIGIGVDTAVVNAVGDNIADDVDTIVVGAQNGAAALSPAALSPAALTTPAAMSTTPATLTTSTISTALNVAPTLIPVLTGTEIDAMSDAELAQRVMHVDVYARTSPQHKLRLVRALQESGQVVAMTGDGVNDAPALHQADIGVAMGEKGTEIAKEAAEMVLTDDNFATIVHAIAEGRTVHDNLKKTILYVLPTSVAQALIIVVAIFIGWTPPITPVQILWVNMTTAVVLSLPLGFEALHSDVMRRPPRAKDEPLLSLFLGWRTALVSLLLVVAVFVLAAVEGHIGVIGAGAVSASRATSAMTSTVAVNMIVLGEIVYLLNCRRIFGSVLNRDGLFGSKLIWLAISVIVMLQLLFTYLPAMQRFFGSAAIGTMQWLHIVLMAVVVFFLVELEKLVLRNWKSA